MAYPNRRADVALLPVLDAQEHRDTDALCALLGRGSSTVREAAALAFASVQDSASTPCLKALGDEEVAVRVMAVFALGFFADSTTITRKLTAIKSGSTTTSAMFKSLHKYRELYPREGSAHWSTTGPRAHPATVFGC